MARKGDWILTHTGVQFWPLDPRPDEIHIEDIAHSLSLQCRYNGHVKEFYSVAEHCVLVANIVSPRNALWALLHDASEAYITDIPRPIKPFLQNYEALESVIMDAVCERFGLPYHMPSEVKDIDRRICGDEMDQLMPYKSEGLGASVGARVFCWTPQVAKARFLHTFASLQHPVVGV